MLSAANFIYNKDMSETEIAELESGTKNVAQSPAKKSIAFKDVKQHLLVFLKGLILGATFRLPGISGGTVAIMIGIYHKLLHAINHIFSDFKRNAIFLGTIAVAGLLSFFLLNRVLLHVTEAIPAISAYFFVGMIIASFLAIYKDSQIKIRTATRKQILLGSIPLLAGLALIASLGAIQAGINMNFTGAAYHAYVVVSGILGGMVFILPGLSFIYFLMILGIDNDFALAVDTFDFSFLLPFAIGMVIGFLVAVKVIFILHILSGRLRPFVLSRKSVHLFLASIQIGRFGVVSQGFGLNNSFLENILTASIGHGCDSIRLRQQRIKIPVDLQPHAVVYFEPLSVHLFQQSIFVNLRQHSTGDGLQIGENLVYKRAYGENQEKLGNGTNRGKDALRCSGDKRES